jgi:hypothetical protein
VRPSPVVVRLSWLIAALATLAAGAGLLWPGGGEPFAFTTLRGDTALIYGRGLYRYDTPLIAVGFMVGDAVTLFLGVPILLVAARSYRRGSVRGGVALAGLLAYFLYSYGSLALGAAYNSLFLAYIALFSASLFAFILAFASLDGATLPASLAPRAPWRSIAIYLVVAGLVLLAVWLGLSILPAQLRGEAPPEVESYTTVITFVIDLAVIAPALIAAGVLLLRGSPAGFPLAATLLVFTVTLGVSLLAAGVVQMLAGLVSVGQFAGFTLSFALLTLAAAWFVAALFGGPERRREREAARRSAF